jgi:hypothetical protein
MGANIMNGSADKPLIGAHRAVLAVWAFVIKSVETGALATDAPVIRKR